MAIEETTWTGKLPETWDTCPLKYAFSIEKRIAGKEGYTVLSITQSGIKPKNMSAQGQFAQDYSKYQLVYPGDFAMNHMDLLTGWIDISKYEGVTSPDYRVFTNKNPKKFLSEYYKYIFQFCYSGKVFYGMGQGVSGLGRWRLPAEMFLNFRLPVPLIEEQQTIVAYLDQQTSKIDSVIAEAKASIEEYKAWKASIIYEAVTKGLNPNVEMKDSGIEWIGDIPIEWSIIPFTKGIDSIVDYRGKTPEKVSEGVFLVTARNIKDGAINYDLAKEYVRTEEYDEIMHRGIPEIGDVLFTTEAPLGEVANVDRTGFALAQRIIKFRAKPDILDNYFLKYWMMSFGFQQNLYTFATGSTAKGIKASKLGQLKTILPPIDEQKQIVTYLDRKWAEINNIISEKETLIADLEAYKKSLIFEVVTGKRRVC